MNKNIFHLLKLSGIPWVFREFVNKRRVTILCFHSPLPEIAEKHYQLLKSKYNIIQLKDYIDILTGNSTSPLPTKALIITLDDGFKENYKLLPILKRYKIPLTIFACSSIVGTHRHYWWRHVPGEVDSSELELCPNSERLEMLKQYNFEENKEFDDRQALSIEEIKGLQEFVDFQTHTQYHPALPQCDSDKAESEIAESKKELEEKINTRVFAIAFPNGKYTDREIEIVKKNGYSCSLTTDEGHNDINSDPFLLKRIDIQDDVNLSELIVKTSGVWNLIKSAIK